MNSNVMPSRVKMEPILLQQLVAEVKETIAEVDTQKKVQPASFKAIDLWNIRRNGRFANNGTNRRKSTSLSVTHVSF
jgi:hypothetical protein